MIDLGIKIAMVQYVLGCGLAWHQNSLHLYHRLICRRLSSRKEPVCGRQRQQVGWCQVVLHPCGISQHGMCATYFAPNCYATADHEPGTSQAPLSSCYLRQFGGGRGS